MRYEQTNDPDLGVQEPPSSGRLKNPKPQFRSLTIPRYVLEEFWDGNINAKEMILLATIDLFVVKGKGCWASNEYLGLMIHSKVSQLSEMITHLKELELVRQVGFDGRNRYLTTCYSDDPRGSAFGKPGRRHPGNPGGDIPETRDHKGKRISEEEIPPMPPQGGAGVNGASFLPEKEEGPPFGRDCTHNLVRCLRTHGKETRPANLKAWTGEFSRMALHLGPDRVRRVLDWYLAHFGEKFVPRAYSAKTFWDKFAQIEDAMERKGLDIPTDTRLEDLKPPHQEMYQEILDLGWPASARKELLGAMVLTTERVRPWQEAAREFGSGLKPGDRLFELHQFLTHELLCRDWDFTESWWRLVHEAVGRRKRLNLSEWLFRPDHELFREWGERLALDFVEDESKWGKYFEAVQKCRQEITRAQ